MPSMTSRERMLAAIDGREPDHIPCSFMLYNAVRDKSADYNDFVRRQVALGFDTYAQVPPRPPVWKVDHKDLQGLPVSYDPEVEVAEWVEYPAGKECPILVKEYRTPAGILRAEVRRTEDWPWGNHVPFLDDYLTPRSRRFPVQGLDDLEPLSYLLAAPGEEEIARFRARSQAAIDLAREHDLLLTGGWGVGADLVGWVSGLEQMMFDLYDRPEFVGQLLDLIARWNRARMRVLLDAGIDLYIKRAWYENCDFFTPAKWRRFILPILEADADLAHEHGARLGYIITSNCMPLLPIIAEAGVDVIIGVDPGEWELEAAKRVLGGKVCLWGGVSGHLTVEQGDEEEVRREVRRAMEVLGPDGFILSPVDNVREDTPTARANTAALLDEWRQCR